MSCCTILHIFGRHVIFVFPSLCVLNGIFGYCILHYANGCVLSVATRGYFFSVRYFYMFCEIVWVIAGPVAFVDVAVPFLAYFPDFPYLPFRMYPKVSHGVFSSMLFAWSFFFVFAFAFVFSWWSLRYPVLGYLFLSAREWIVSCSAPILLSRISVCVFAHSRH